MLQETFQFYKPCKELSPYVRYYWVFKSEQSLNTYTFPIGCPQLIFHKQSPLYIPELDTFQSPFTISGQVNFSSHLSSSGPIEMIVAVFYPHTINLFLPTPISLFYNQEVSGYDIDHAPLKELALQVFDCEDNDRCVGLIEKWLLSSMSATSFSAVDYKVKRIQAAIETLCTNPQVSVSDLSSVCCLSNKQLTREFNTLVGMNPKEYIRMVRFQKALAYMQHHRDGFNQAQMALTCGYADQSHCIREFKRISGYTPVSLLEIAEPYSDLFTHPV